MSDTASTFEREKWEADVRLRERELAVKEREVTLKADYQARSRLSDPLVLAICGATIAGVFNAVIAWQNSRLQRQLEADKASAEQVIESSRAEAARILEVIKTGNPDDAAENLTFLVDTGLIANPAIKQSLEGYLRNRERGTGASLPIVANPGPGALEDMPPSLRYVCDAGGRDQMSFAKDIRSSLLGGGGVVARDISLGERGFAVFVFSDGKRSFRALVTMSEESATLVILVVRRGHSQEIPPDPAKVASDSSTASEGPGALFAGHEAALESVTPILTSALSRVSRSCQQVQPG